MASQEEQINVLRIFTGTEEAIGRLYETYAGKLPEHEEFWFGLAMEEADHSNLIHGLIGKVKNGAAGFMFDNDVVDKVTLLKDRLEREQEKAGRQPLSFTDALSTAIDINKSLVDEQGLYHLLKETSQAVNETLARLHRETEKHIRFLEKELARYR